MQFCLAYRPFDFLHMEKTIIYNTGKPLYIGRYHTQISHRVSCSTDCVGHWISMTWFKIRNALSWYTMEYLLVTCFLVYTLAKRLLFTSRKYKWLVRYFRVYHAEVLNNWSICKVFFTLSYVTPFPQFGIHSLPSQMLSIASSIMRGTPNSESGVNLEIS